MTQREKLLAAAVVGTIALIAAFWLVNRVSSGFDEREVRLAKLQSEVAEKHSKLRRGERAKAQLQDWQSRSLSSDVSRAQTAYQVWLHGLAAKAGLQAKFGTERHQRDLFVQHTFQVSGEAELRRLIEFLHGFYNTGYLHRVNILAADSQPGKKELDIRLTIDALSLNAAPKDVGDQPPAPRRPLDKDVAAYTSAVLARNFFFPANAPPRISSVGSQRGNPNRPLSFTVRATDPDKDTLTYSIVSCSPGVEGAKIDAKSGEFRWTPVKLGSDYEVVVRATDNGSPPQSFEDKIKISVVDPPPVPKEDPFAKDDPARDAKVTALVGPLDDLQVWVRVPRGMGDQPRTLYLKEGDKISVGSFTGTVKEVRDREAEFELKDGRTVVVRLDQSLVSGDKKPAGL